MLFDDIETVVFDLDDTLYPETEYVKSGFKAVDRYLVSRGVVKSSIYRSLWDLFSSGLRGTIFNESLVKARIDPSPELIQQLVYQYRTHIPDISLYRDAAEVLQQLKGKRKMALLTDGYGEAQKNKVTALGIKHFFDTIMYTDDLGRECWKPHTSGFIAIMNKLEVAGSRCVYIGDNPSKDFAAPRSLGWKSIRIQRAEGLHANMQENSNAPADLCIKNLYPLLDMVSGTFQ